MYGSSMTLLMLGSPDLEYGTVESITVRYATSSLDQKNRQKSTSSSKQRVLLLEVVKDGGGVVARELDRREGLELVEPLPAVEAC